MEECHNCGAAIYWEDARQCPECDAWHCLKATCAMWPFECCKSCAAIEHKPIPPAPVGGDGEPSPGDWPDEPGESSVGSDDGPVTTLTDIEFDVSELGETSEDNGLMPAGEGGAAGLDLGDNASGEMHSTTGDETGTESDDAEGDGESSSSQDSQPSEDSQQGDSEDDYDDDESSSDDDEYAADEETEYDDDIDKLFDDIDKLFDQLESDSDDSSNDDSETESEDDDESDDGDNDGNDPQFAMYYQPHRIKLPPKPEPKADEDSSMSDSEVPPEVPPYGEFDDDDEPAGPDPDVPVMRPFKVYAYFNMEEDGMAEFLADQGLPPMLVDSVIEDGRFGRHGEVTLTCLIDAKTREIVVIDCDYLD